MQCLCANKNENKWKREEEVKPYETEKMWTELFLTKSNTFFTHHTFFSLLLQRDT